MMKMVGLLAMVPASILLMTSFFVLFAAEKSKEVDLRRFGKVVATVLVIVSSLLFGKAIYTAVTGLCPWVQPNANGTFPIYGIQKYETMQPGALRDSIEKRQIKGVIGGSRRAAAECKQGN